MEMDQTIVAIGLVLLAWVVHSYYYYTDDARISTIVFAQVYTQAYAQMKTKDMGLLRRVYNNEPITEEERNSLVINIQLNDDKVYRVGIMPDL